MTSLKDQLGYAARDFLYYKKRCGRDVATLEPIDYIKHAEIMIQDNEMEKEIRLVLSQQQETRQPVSITPLERPRQQPEEEENPFMDDALDAYKVWLKKAASGEIQRYTVYVSEYAFILFRILAHLYKLNLI